MARAPLSQLDDWELDHESQDLRGHRLVDERGALLGTVREMIVDTDAERVDAIVLDDGAEYPVSTFEIRDGTAVLRSPAGQAATGEVTAIPLVEEHLRVRKRAAQLGEVEVKKRVETEQQTVEVPLTREEVVVERQEVEPRPAERPIGADGETIRVPIMGEEAVVEKEALVTGEVMIGKRAVQETRQVQDAVRRSRVEVESEDEEKNET